MPEGGGGGFDDGSQSEVNPAFPVPCTLLPERKGIVVVGEGVLETLKVNLKSQSCL